MSVLIKGAKPPSGCRWCYFNDDGKCVLIVGCDYDETNGTQRRKDCPLIELPEHGDLIDRDALRQEMRLSDSCSRCERDAYRCQYYDEITVMDVCGRIDDMPVVIPAERSE